ncbi:hypothetical protein F4Y59_02485, partial [Candidatus Poribacteria bacterium]|nr:hypothetical protein [Candidatus Poribacteria bacterium]
MSESGFTGFKDLRDWEPLLQEVFYFSLTHQSEGGMLREISVEVVGLNTPKYPNRYALREALDIYLEAMSLFVSKYLDVDIKEEEIEEKDIAHYIETGWNTFKEQFKVYDRYGKFHHYYEARTVTSLIVEGRNRNSHQRLKDLNPLFTRAQLFFIAEILGKIDALDAQGDV